MPKGVVWRHEDVFYALGGGTDPVTNAADAGSVDHGGQGCRRPMVHLPVAPLMHGATQWCVMGQSFVGSKIVLMAKFDPHEVWRLVERGAGELRHDHRRRHGQAPDRVARRPGGGPRPLLARGRGVVGGAVLGAR